VVDTMGIPIAGESDRCQRFR